MQSNQIFIRLILSNFKQILNIKFIISQHSYIYIYILFYLLKLYNLFIFPDSDCKHIFYRRKLLHI